MTSLLGYVRPQWLCLEDVGSSHGQHVAPFDGTTSGHRVTHLATQQIINSQQM